MNLLFLRLCILLKLTLFLSFYMSLGRDFLVDGLTIMKNRGYDSAGLATMAAEGGPMVRYATICWLIVVCTSLHPTAP
jgi:hypothetical protein